MLLISSEIGSGEQEVQIGNVPNSEVADFKSNTEAAVKSSFEVFTCGMGIS